MLEVEPPHIPTGVNRVGATCAGVFVSIIPVSGSFLSSVIHREQLSTSFWTGLCRVAAAVLVTDFPVRDAGPADRNRSTDDGTGGGGDDGATEDAMGTAPGEGDRRSSSVVMAQEDCGDQPDVPGWTL